MKLSVSSAIAGTLMGMFSTASADVLLQDFTSGDSGWEFKSDDVIPGGESDGILLAGGDRTFFDGTVVDQPFIGGPGFVKAVGIKSFPNIAGCAAIEVTMNPLTSYEGYFVAFGDTPPTPDMPIPSEWRTAIPVFESGENRYSIPFHQFSNAWDFATGKIITPCYADSTVCPTTAVLSNIQFMEIWGQGVEGRFVTELFSIKAVGC